MEIAIISHHWHSALTSDTVVYYTAYYIRLLYTTHTQNECILNGSVCLSEIPVDRNRTARLTGSRNWHYERVYMYRYITQAHTYSHYFNIHGFCGRGRTQILREIFPIVCTWSHINLSTLRDALKTIVIGRNIQKETHRIKSHRYNDVHDLQSCVYPCD